MWLRILSIAREKELKVLDYPQWLHYYYLVSLAVFFCFRISHFSDKTYSLTKIFHGQKAGRRCGVGWAGKDHRVLLCFIRSWGYREIETFVHHTWNKHVMQLTFPLIMCCIWFNLLHHIISLSSSLELKDVLTVFQALYSFCLFKFLYYVLFIYLVSFGLAAWLTGS